MAKLLDFEQIRNVQFGLLIGTPMFSLLIDFQEKNPQTVAKKIK